MRNKKTLVAVLGILGIIIATIGITYAFFSYSRMGNKINSIKSGNITFKYTENSRGINIDDAMPMTDAQGKVDTNYFDFTVDSKTSDIIDIPYYITVDAADSNLTMFNIVKLYLTKVDNQGNETGVINPTKFSELGTYTNTDGINIPVTEKLVYSDRVFAGESSYTQKYRLRMWIDYDADYVANNYNDLDFKITVNVYSTGKMLTSNQVNYREIVDIEDIEIGSNTVTSSTTTLTESETMPVGSTTIQKTITVNTVNPDAIVTVENLTPTSMNTNVKRLSSNHTVDLVLGTNTFKITITSVTRRTSKDYTLVITTAYPEYDVTLSGSNLTFQGNISSIKVSHNGTNTVQVNPSSGYYLSGVSCSTGYTHNAIIGTSATSSQAVTITNNNYEGTGSCTFSATQLDPTVTMAGSNVTFSNNSITVIKNSYSTVTVTPASGYYLASASCTNGYTTNATTGISATSAQTVQITNPNTYNNSTCTFTTAKYYTTSSSIASAYSSSTKVIACDIYTANNSSKYYNCGSYTTLQAAFDSRDNGYVILRNNLTTTTDTILASGKTFILDLYGRALNSTTAGGRGIMNYGNLTINNSTSTIGAISADGAAVRNSDTSAVLVINKGNYQSANSGAPAINVAAGSVTINDGTYTVSSINGSGVICGSNSSFTNATLVINGGTFTSPSTAEYPGSVIRIRSTSSLVNSLNSITINGGTFNNTGNGTVIQNDEPKTITINGGKFVANNNYAMLNNGTGTINISQTSSKGPIYIKASIFGIQNEASGTINITASRANNCNATLSNTTSGLCIYTANNAPIRNYGSGTVNVNGGTYTANNGAGLQNTSTGKVYIKNATFNTSTYGVFNATSGKGELYICSSTLSAGTYHFVNQYSGDLIKYYNITFQGVSTSRVDGTNLGTIQQVSSCPF